MKMNISTSEDLYVSFTTSNNIELLALENGPDLMTTMDRVEDIDVSLDDNKEIISASLGVGIPIPSGGGEGCKCTHIVYTIIQQDTTDIEAAIAKLPGVEFIGGDVLVIKTPSGIAASYLYSKDKIWQVFTGSVSAENVIFENDILCAGDYTQVGNVTKGQKETKTIPTTNKSLADLMQTIFTKEQQPTKTEPSVSISLAAAGALEVGSTVNPSYSISYNTGSYTYDTSTGVQFAAPAVIDSDGHTSDKKTDNFPSFVVLDNTKYSISVSASHTAGIIAHTNLGNESNPPIQIQAGTKSATSGSITGYRPFFYGISLDTNPLDSDAIRALTNGGNYNGSKKVTVSVAGALAKRIIVAVPALNTRAGVTKVEKTDGLVTDITTTYIKQATKINVDDKRKTGTNLVPYTLWIYQPASIDAAEIHEITLG